VDAADVDLLVGLVRERSVTGDTDRCARWLADACAERKFDEAFVDEAGNAVAVAGTGPREILMVGHLDTVPGELPVHVADGVLWGRGSVDAKGPLASFLAAARHFIGSTTHRIVVVGACDEEGESHGARALLPRHRPEALVIGEPSGVDGVTIGYKGIVKIGYALEDDLAHGGAPHPSVPDRAVAFWTATQAYLAQRHGESLFDSPTIKLHDMSSRLLPNGRVRVEMRGSARTPPGFDTPEFLEFLRARAGGAELDVPEWAPAWLGEKNAMLTRHFVGAIREEGMSPRYVRKTGTSDANLLAPRWGVPCVAYGPGDSSLDHTPQERLALADYEKAIGVLRRVLGALTAT
jgi:LysW-gamma-L-lysine carboxypeptidase